MNRGKLTENYGYGPFTPMPGQRVIPQHTTLISHVLTNMEIVGDAAYRLSVMHAEWQWRWFLWEANTNERLVALVCRNRRKKEWKFRVDVREKNPKDWTTDLLIHAITTKIVEKEQA